LGAVAGIVGQRTGWAVAVILIGLGLAGLGMLVSRLRHPHVPVPGTGGRL
jgi:hypothetical protein